MRRTDLAAREVTLSFLTEGVYAAAVCFGPVVKKETQSCKSFLACRGHEAVGTRDDRGYKWEKVKVFFEASSGATASEATTRRSVRRPIARTLRRSRDSAS